jgi:hypothetical protein
MTPVIKFTRSFDDIDGFQTWEKVWETVSGSYLLERHAANPKSGSYESSMTPEGLRQWMTEHPEGMTTSYDPVQHLPL